MPDQFDIDAVIELERALRRQNPAPSASAERVGELVEVIRDAGIHVTSEHAVALAADERQAMDHLMAYMKIVEADWKLKFNHDELRPAIHVLQGFIVQHMLHRLNPAGWSNWYEAD